MLAGGEQHIGLFATAGESSSLRLCHGCLQVVLSARWPRHDSYNQRLFTLIIGDWEGFGHEHCFSPCCRCSRIQ